MQLCFVALHGPVRINLAIVRIGTFGPIHKLRFVCNKEDS
jgi:hypothetical protein